MEVSISLKKITVLPTPAAIGNKTRLKPNTDRFTVQVVSMKNKESPLFEALFIELILLHFL